MATRKTCDKCIEYTPGKSAVYEGSCAQMGDANDYRGGEINKCNGWDYEGYRAGVYVGPKFGCIHWTKKEKQ